MKQKSVPEKEPATQVVKNIRRATRRHFSAEDKIRIVLEGLRGESRRLLYLERSCGVCDRAQCNAVSTGGMPAATEPWVIQVCGPFPISTTHDAQSSDWANVDPCGAAAGSRRWKSFRASTPAAFERGPLQYALETDWLAGPRFELRNPCARETPGYRAVFWARVCTSVNPA